jgi:hypothetical protein
VTFDEWWNKKAARGQWVGEYETDAEANARIGWEAALSRLSRLGACRAPSGQFSWYANGDWQCGCGASNKEPGCRYKR